MHIAVNFHYIGMPKMPYPGIQGCDAKQFSDALHALAGDYHLVT